MNWGPLRLPAFPQRIYILIIIRDQGKQTLAPKLAT